MVRAPSLSVVVAFRDSAGGERGRLWDFVRAHLERDFPRAEIVVGTDDSTPFNKAAAFNRAVAASSGDTLLLTDTDTWVHPDQLAVAVRGVDAIHRWWRPYRIKLKLLGEDTERALASGLDWTFERYKGQRFENVTSFRWAPPLVLSREMYEAVGGHDERFANGWGSEDEAFGRSLVAFFGDQVTVPGFAIHLYHPRLGKSGHDLWDGQTSRDENKALGATYRAAKTPAAMRALISAR